MPLNQRNFPAALPVFNLLFSGKSRVHALIYLEPYQPMHAIPPRESLHHVMFMLQYPFDRHAGNTDIQCAVIFTGQYIHSWLPGHTLLLQALQPSPNTFVAGIKEQGLLILLLRPVIDALFLEIVAKADMKPDIFGENG